MLVNNAGIESRTSLLDTAEDDYDRVMAVNLKSAFFATQYAAKQFIAQGGGGVVINVSSVHEDWPMPGNSVYCVSKGGMRMLGRNRGVELGPHGIRVVNVCPGAVATPINRSTLDDPDKLKRLTDAIPACSARAARRHRRRRRLPGVRAQRLHDRDLGLPRRRADAEQPRAVST